MHGEPVEERRAEAGASAELYGLSELAYELDAIGKNHRRGVLANRRDAGGGERAGESEVVGNT